MVRPLSATLRKGDPPLAHPRRLANLHGQVSEIIALRILGGTYAPGDVLPTERALYEELGVSRTTLREAMKNLSSKGLVAIGPSVGTRVRARPEWNLLDIETMRWRLQLGVTTKLVEDIYELRECFEPFASRYAAERGTDAQHLDIRASYLQLAASREAGGRESVEADLRFHKSILISAGNDMLSALGAVVEGALEASFQIARARANLSAADIKQHKAIMEAILARDGLAAMRATETTLRTSKAVQIAAVRAAEKR
jgi:DNA-binding FadR family transcriptional regulator